jgi:hypothetical protein
MIHTELVAEFVFHPGEGELCQVRGSSNPEAAVAFRCPGKCQVYWHLWQVCAPTITHILDIAPTYGVDSANGWRVC